MGDPGSFGTRWGWAPWDSSLPRSWDSREFLPSLLLVVRSRLGSMGKRWMDGLRGHEKWMTFEQVMDKLKGLYTSSAAVDVLHEEYEQCVQDGRHFQEYATELESFKQILGDQISGVQLNRHLLRGADVGLQEATYALINPEAMSFREITEIMQKYDDAARALEQVEEHGEWCSEAQGYVEELAGNGEGE